MVVVLSGGSSTPANKGVGDDKQNLRSSYRERNALQMIIINARHTLQNPSRTLAWSLASKARAKQKKLPGVFPRQMLKKHDTSWHCSDVVMEGG
jgi:hypothetical protein